MSYILADDAAESHDRPDEHISEESTNTLAEAGHQREDADDATQEHPEDSRQEESIPSSDKNATDGSLPMVEVREIPGDALNNTPSPTSNVTDAPATAV